jgi:hypothetical protein
MEAAMVNAKEDVIARTVEWGRAGGWARETWQSTVNQYSGQLRHDDSLVVVADKQFVVLTARQLCMYNCCKEALIHHVQKHPETTSKHRRVRTYTIV